VPSRSPVQYTGRYSDEVSQASGRPSAAAFQEPGPELRTHAGSGLAEERPRTTHVTVRTPCAQLGDTWIQILSVDASVEN
jgi:hypothetical protein